MTRTIYCKKLHQESAGLAKAPYPGELGEKIYQNISQQAWQMWLAEQTRLINEHRLSIIDPQTKEFLREEMKKFLLLTDE